MKKFKDIVLTGDRPTGKLHLGHYVASIKNRIALQDKYDTCFYMVADVQGLTDNADDPDKIRENVAEVVMDNLACGLDPEKTIFFVQSAVPEIAELTVFFLNLVTVSRLKQNPTVKTEIKQKGYQENIPAGFLTYPVSQSADILFAKATHIPVGEDQLPMIEQANEISEKFNRYYGEIFPHVTAVKSEISRLVGIDGNAKASKSLGNAIFLSDSDEEISKKVMSMYTDPNHIHVEDPGNVEGNVVFEYLDAFGTDKEKISNLKSDYRKGGLGDVEIKKYLIEVLTEIITPIRNQRAELEDKKDYIMDILEKGSAVARKHASETMYEVRKAMKIDYFN